MHSTPLVLALLSLAPSLLVTAVPQATPAASALYIITSATIRQQDWTYFNANAPPANKTNPSPPNNQPRHLRLRQNPPGAATTTGSYTLPPSPTASSPPSPAALENAQDPPNTNDGTPSHKMETFTFAFIPGAANASPPQQPINCNLTWDAATANAAATVVSKEFTCTGGGTARMERRNVTPIFGFYIFVSAGGKAEAAWMARDLPHSAGWSVDGANAVEVFKGPAVLTGVPHQTLQDFEGWQDANLG